MILAGGIKRLLPRTLFGRSLLIIVMPLIILQVVATWIFYDRHWDIVSKRLASGVAGDIAMLIAMLNGVEDERQRMSALRLLAGAADVHANLHPGAILGNDPVPPPRTILERQLTRALERIVRRPFRIDSRGNDRYVRIELQLPGGVVEAIVPRERLFTSTTYIFVLWMVGSSLVLFAVAGMFMRNQVRPIRRLAAAADAFGKGRDVGDFAVSGAAEVRQAAAAFKVMRDRIRRQIAQRTEMLAGVSHDLRTPLTRMRLGLALLPPSAETGELRRDLDEMERMLEGYLAFARGEGGEAAEPTDLAALLDEVAEDARRQGGEVALRCPASMRLWLRPQAMKRCLGNLVGNGLRYGGRVWIKARRRAGAAEILVDDDGPGVPACERENVFRPFYRLDSSRNPGTGGTGLGLAIARDIVHGHGGTIRVEDAPGGGARFVVRLPL